MQRPLGSAAPADQLIRESMVKPLHCDIGCMWSCPILLKPLYISIYTMTCSKCHPGLVQLINVMLFCNTDYLLICVFKPKQFDYSMFWDGHPHRAFHRVQGPLKHLIWSFCSPVHTEPEVCFITEPNIIKEVSLVLEPLAHHLTFFHVS